MWPQALITVFKLWSQIHWIKPSQYRDLFSSFCSCRVVHCAMQSLPITNPSAHCHLCTSRTWAHQLDEGLCLINKYTVCLRYIAKICITICINKQHITPFYVILRMETFLVFLIFFFFGKNCRGQTMLHPATNCNFPMALPLRLPGLNTPLFNWHRIAVAVSVAPLHTLAQASSSLALTFVKAQRFISSISWHCLDSQEAFSQIK